MLRLAALLAALSVTAFAQQTGGTEGERQARIYRDKVEAHWWPDGNSFWYLNDLPGGKKEFVLVDAVKGERRVVDEPPKLPRDLNAGLELRPSRGDSSTETLLRFINRSGQEARLFWIDSAGRRQGYGSVKPNETREQHTFEGHVWWLEGADGTPLGSYEGEATVTDAVIESAARDGAPKREAKPEEAPADWRASIKQHNVWIKNRLTGEDVQLSHDGKPDDPYQPPFHWAPDGKKLVVLQTKPAQERKVWLVESAPRDQLQPKLQSYDYLKPGDRIAQPRPRLFDAEKRAQIPVTEDLFGNPWSVDGVHWAPDSSRFFFEYNQRGHQIMRVLAVDAATGATQAIVEETSATFIDYSQKRYLHWLDATNELVWASERDGWNHVYLYDTKTGAVKTQITRGPWVVRGVERIDAEQRVAWLRVMGVRIGEDPYHFHLARVNLDGSDFTVLTEGDGTHQWEWSPDRRFFIDTWSRVDQPPVIELRRAADGQRVCELERADPSALLATGWRAPERFVAKGRDGATDIVGILFRPRKFDAARHYPVIEQIYAGPQDFFVPKAWSRFGGQQALADLGFVVVQIDGMGTNWRSRAFHDVAWKNLRDAGFPDRIAWLRAAATTRSWMDLSRVGIFGGSAGGQSALGALLFHGDFYQAAVADCGCHDNRMDKIWWNEAWMGWPVGPEYASSSNVTHAARLTGKLLLTVGELDKNVDPASTMQVVNALIKADKDFDLLVVPGAGHGVGSAPYGRRRRDEFFVRHLLHHKSEPASAP